MQIKSWQIALAGIILQIFVGLLILGIQLFTRGALEISTLIGVFFGYYIIALAYSPLIPITLGLCMIGLFRLRSEKTSKSGAIICIIFSIIFLLINGGGTLSSNLESNYFLNSLAYGYVVGFSFLLAGIHYFWKKSD